MIDNDALLAADLRDRMVPCGDCEEDELSDIDGTKRDVRRVETELEGHIQENLRVITSLQTNYAHITQALESQGRILEQIDKRMAHIEVALGAVPAIKERMETMEAVEAKRSQDYVPRNEYNGSLVSVSQYAEAQAERATAKAEKVEGRLTMMVWGIGLTLAGISGVVGFIAARVF